VKFIAWDTSSKSGAIVAMETSAQGLRLCSELHSNVDTAHSEGLLWAIDQVMKSCGWSWDDVDFIGVGAGPGSFTGLRIGLTTARTLAHALGKKIVSVSSLEALARPVAQQMSDQSQNAMLVAATDACKGELFVLLGHAAEVLVGEYVESVLTPEQLMVQLREIKGPWCAVGEGRQRYPEEWRQLEGSQELKFSASQQTVQGVALGQIVWENYQKMGAQPPLEVTPRYLRAPDAEVKLKAKLSQAFAKKA
jgi:tRNA threonylcarbamoyladenosine biosynthesis protein TsaB